MSVGFNRQDSDRHGKLEAARAAGAGIEVEDASFRNVIGDVGVAVEDGGEFRCGGIEVEGFELMEHVEVEAGVRRVLNEDNVGFWKLAAWAFAIDVAADGGYGSNFGEFVEDGDFSYIAAVKNAVDAGEGWQDFGAKQAVGIGDDSKLHVFRISCAGGGRLREGAHAN
jgi:hypothetical protein